MTLKDTIQSLEKLEIELRDAYLNRLIDFLKWTATIALAIGLWLGTNFDKYVPSITKKSIENQSYVNSSIVSNLFATINPVFFISSLACIIMSLFSAVVVIYFIIGIWEVELKFIERMNVVIDLFNKNRNKETFSDEEFLEQIDDVETSRFNFKNVKTLNTFFKIHILLFIIGIFCLYTGIMFH
jgi:hypothetical protein